METLFAGGILGFFAGLVLFLGWWAWPLLLLMCAFGVCFSVGFGVFPQRKIMATIFLVPSMLLFYHLVGWGLVEFFLNHWRTLLWVIGGHLLIGGAWCIFGRWNLKHMRFSGKAKKAFEDFVKSWKSKICEADDPNHWTSELSRLGYAPPAGEGSGKERYSRVSEAAKTNANDKRTAAIALLANNELPKELEAQWDENEYSHMPRASEHKLEIAYWIFAWPIDIPVWIVTDLAWDFIEGVIRWFGGVFSWVASWHYRDMDPRYIK